MVEFSESFQYKREKETDMAEKIFVQDKLTVKKYDTRAEMGAAAAAHAGAIIKELLSKKESISVIFAAAPSQNEILAGLVADKEIDWTRVNAFHMDEYVGLDAAAPQRFGNFLANAIFAKVPFKSVNYINGNAADIDAECARYGKLLAEAKVDLVCMGIGENGHIAFNDPHVADFEDKVAVKKVELDEKCRNQQVNDGCFAKLSDVPTHALTLTIPTLVNVDYIVCTVPAATKAEAVYNMVNADITPAVPCTILRRHNNATAFIDGDSGALLK